MQLGRSLAPPMLGPVHIVGHQLDGRGVDRVNRPREASGQSTFALLGAMTEAGRLRLKMIKRLPEQLLGHVGVALSVRVGETVATGAEGAANRSQPGTMIAQIVTQIIQ